MIEKPTIEEQLTMLDEFKKDLNSRSQEGEFDQVINIFFKSLQAMYADTDRAPIAYRLQYNFLRQTEQLRTFLIDEYLDKIDHEIKNLKLILEQQPV